MMNDTSIIYAFDDFRLDTERLALYHQDALVKNCDKKTIQVLAVLLLNPNKLTTHDEIIENVWQDNPHGITSGHIGQYISRLRKTFAELAPGKHYVETVKGRGYSFTGDVSSSEYAISANSETALPDEQRPILSATEKVSDKTLVSEFAFRKAVIIFSIVILGFLIFFSAWKQFAKTDEEVIRQTVRESQFYESLVLYKNPSSFQEAQLDKYWTAELDGNLNSDRTRIREAVKKLINESRRYGDETKCEQFEFQSVEINRDENFAVVKTLEKWFIAVYFNDGTLQQNKYVGPYFVSYILRKVDGRWLIEKSNTARVNRPVPRLSDIEVASAEIKSGKQFFVKITGQDFEAETIYLEIFGAGCPENRPCKITNIALRENSNLTGTQLENVPLTLPSGEFRIVAHNGDSQPSNTLILKVP